MPQRYGPAVAPHIPIRDTSGGPVVGLNMEITTEPVVGVEPEADPERTGRHMRPVMGSMRQARPTPAVGQSKEFSMSRARLGVLAIAAAAGLLLAAASPAMAGDVSTISTTHSPVGDWVTRTSGVKQAITFTKDGKVFGEAGCNHFTGAYTTNGSQITIGPLATTLMMCEENVMNAEATFLVRLQAAVGYQAKPKTLKVFAPKDLLHFVKA